MTPERKPIITEPHQITLVQSPPSIHDLLPDYQYQFQNHTPNAESTKMYNELVDFISTNEEIAVMNITDKTEYGNGFKRAMAMVRLWLDSMYLGE